MVTVTPMMLLVNGSCNPPRQLKVGGHITQGEIDASMIGPDSSRVVEVCALEYTLMFRPAKIIVGTREGNKGVKVSNHG
ncbi:hypothetical protein V6N13_045316 [Hibiscus sabdariffa]|uniref:Uncharacterized protein n=1 Tax=Hibiscus sabdariffa TaxID=183260 RepID=A0ABR2RKT9_9ROSI